LIVQHGAVNLGSKARVGSLKFKEIKDEEKRQYTQAKGKDGGRGK